MDLEDKIGNKVSILVVVLLAVSTGLAGYAILNINYNIDENTYFANATAVNETDFEDGDIEIGIDAARSLQYGEPPIGSNITKTLEFNAPRQTLVELESSGNITDHLEYEDRTYIEGEEEIEVTFNAKEPGYFEGDVDLTVTVPENRVSKLWLDITSYF